MEANKPIKKKENRAQAPESQDVSPGTPQEEAIIFLFNQYLILGQQRHNFLKTDQG